MPERAQLVVAHVVDVVPYRYDYRAECSCGWAGPERIKRQDAAAHGYEHELATGVAAILAEELEARADTLELAARSGARLPSYPGGIEQLGQRVRILRREAERLRGRP